MRIKLIIILTIVIIVQSYISYNYYVNYVNASNYNSELLSDIEALNRSDFESLQIIDKDYKRIIENRIKRNGLQNYRLAYDDIRLFFDESQTIVSSEYGNRWIWNRWMMHYGVDIIFLYDLIVLSGISGKVIVSEFDRSYGYYVRIKNDDYILTYAHLEGSTLEVGDYVNQGSFIGYVGETGEITGLHLHFSIAKKQDDGHYYSVNPFRNSTYNKIVDVTKHRGRF